MSEKSNKDDNLTDVHAIRKLHMLRTNKYSEYYSDKNGRWFRKDDTPWPKMDWGSDVIDLSDPPYGVTTSEIGRKIRG